MPGPESATAPGPADEPVNSGVTHRHTGMTAREVWCRVTAVTADGQALPSWALVGSGSPDVGVVDRLARLRLAARRRGGDLLLSDVAPELAALIDLVGLCDVLRG